VAPNIIAEVFEQASHQTAKMFFRQACSKLCDFHDSYCTKQQHFMPLESKIGMLIRILTIITSHKH